jgi:hypothetical protein
MKSGEIRDGSLRGGSWGDALSCCRAPVHYRLTPGFRLDLLWFRVARSAKDRRLPSSISPSNPPPTSS